MRQLIGTFYFVAICMVVASNARCAELFRDNFDAHPLGASIRDLSPEVGPVWRASGPVTPSISSITSAGGSNRQLTLSSLPGSGTPYVYADFSSSAPVVQMSFDWHFTSDLNVTGAAAFLETPELLTGIAIVSGGFFELLNKPNIAGSYHASVTFFFETDEIELRLDDLATAMPVDAIRRETTSVPISHISGFAFEMPFGGTGSMNIDNLVIFEIPEPTTCVLLQIAAAFCIVQTRRRNSVSHYRV